MKIFEQIHKNRNKLIIKLVIWSLPLIFLAWLVDKNYAPRGILEVNYQVDQESSILSDFAAKEPDKLIGYTNSDEPFQLITTTPVYFNIKVPRTFSNAEVNLKYKNPDGQPIIKLGVKQSNGAYSYVDMALFNEKIENLEDHWNYYQDGDVVLWQKDIAYYEAKRESIQALNDWYDTELDYINQDFPEADYRSTLDQENYVLQIKQLDDEYEKQLNQIHEDTKDQKTIDPVLLTVDEFINNFPDPEKVLKFNYDLSNYIEMPGYLPSNKTTVINKSIRGSHEIYTYLAEGENLDFIFTFQDINRHPGSDEFTIDVYDKRNNLIKSVKGEDDGNDQADGVIYPARRHQLLIENMPFGVYKLKINTKDDDVFIKKIETKQHLVMFKSNLYLADNIEYESIVDPSNISPTTLYSFNNYVKALTAHDNGLQVVRVGDYNLRLDQVQLENEIKTPREVVPIVSPKNDVRLTGDGYFAFSKDQLFDPNYGVVKDIDNVENVDDYDYIIASYPEVSTSGNWQLATAKVDSSKLYFQKKENSNVISFIIDLPGLPENDRQFKINSLDIKFTRNPITFTRVIEKIKEIF